MKIFMVRTIRIIIRISFLFTGLQPVFSQCGYTWAQWTNQGSTNNAVATLNANGQIINMTLTANYNMNFTSTIFGYGNFSGFQYIPPNATVPQTDWAAGTGGQTTMCFSQPVQNPILLLASIGNPSTPVTLSFSIPYTVLYDAGGCTYTSGTVLDAREGYCVLEFPGIFTCVTIFSNTPEYYSNLTWGIRNPLTADFTYANGCENSAISFSSANSYVNPPATIASYSWSFGDNNASSAPHPSHVYTSAGTYTVELAAIASNGCTDTLQQDITIYPTFTASNPQSICFGKNYSINSHTYTTTGIYRDTFLTGNGCDSIIVTDLTFWPPNITNVFPAICQGEIYILPGGVLVDSSGIYHDTLSAANSCDSVIVTDLTIMPSIVQNNPVFICSGNSYQLPGGSLTDSTGVYYDTLTAANSCDSIIITSITVLPPIIQNDTVFICSGNSYLLPGGVLVDSAGIYHDTLSATNACDSVIITSLTVMPSITQNQSGTICSGDTYQLPGGVVVSDPGVYLDSFQTATGCDSIIETSLMVFPVYQTRLDKTICDGDSLRIGGETYFVSGNYVDSAISINGCDSVLVTNLQVLESIQDTILDTLFTGAFYNGSPVYENISFTNYESTADGCDSIVSVFITVLEKQKINIPTAFSPNDDDINDIFRVLAKDISEIRMLIFNRWGEKVFESHDANIGWDGTYEDEPAGIGTYVYYVEARIDNSLKEYVGTVTLVR